MRQMSGRNGRVSTKSGSAAANDVAAWFDGIEKDEGQRTNRRIPSSVRQGRGLAMSTFSQAPSTSAIGTANAAMTMAASPKARCVLPDAVLVREPE